jgi:PRTRC genetic system ThiF family protein
MKKIQKTYTLNCPHKRFKEITIVGAGGTGSYVVPHIARMITTLDYPVSLTIIDGDHIEKKNLIRQNFCAADIGMNKAEVLATRYAAAFGIEVAYRASYLTAQDVIRPGLIITCTDNLRSRMLIRNALTDSYTDRVWIDCGNEETNGQVIISQSKQAWCSHAYRLPTPFDIFPEYLETVMKEKKIEESCAEHDVASPIQAGFINNMAGAIAVNYAHSVMTGAPIVSHMTKFTISNVFEHVPITDDTIKVAYQKRIVLP